MAMTKLAIFLLGAQLCSAISIATKDRPVTKVVNMLKQMQEDLEKEQKQDEDLYEDLKCWCKDNNVEKTKTIEETEANLAIITSKELNATAQTLMVEMTSLAGEVSKATATLDSARVLHGNKMEKLHDDDTTLQKDIGAVENAATSLGSGAAALLQSPEKLTEVAKRAEDAMGRRTALLEDTLGFRDRETLSAFFKNPVQVVKDGSLVQTGSNSPGLAGGEISGLFTAMKTDFEKELKSVEEEMKKEETTYEELMASKKEEIKAGEAAIESKRQQRVEARQELMENKIQQEKDQKTIDATKDFLAMVQEKCGVTDEEWATRQKTRQEEIESVDEAIQVLDGDEAHATFGRTLGSFLQQKRTASDVLRAASETLAKASRSSKDARLMALAATAEIKGMEKVKAAIDSMAADLKKEGEDEVEKKDFCVSAFRDNTAKKAALTSEKDKHGGQVAVLSGKQNAVATEISELKGKIEEAKKELSVAATEHEEEKKEFAATLADQKATQTLLNKALSSLKSFYLEKPSLVQAEPVPDGFKEYKSNGQGNSVMQLISKVIQDTKALEMETARAQKSAASDYDKLVKSGNKEIDAMTSEVDDLSGSKARLMSDLSAAKMDVKGATKELADVASEEANLHEDCDFLMKNFDMRKDARSQEIDGLFKAKAILSGAKSFLQKN